MAASNTSRPAGWYPLQDAFAEVPYRSHVAIGSFMMIILTLAMVGNTVVIAIFLGSQKLRTPSNSLIVNLAVADLLMALTGFPLLIISSFYGYWAYDQWVCDFYGATATMFGLMSINTLVFISLDRYVVIVSPQNIHKLTDVHVRMCILIIWLYSLVWGILPLFGWNRYIQEGYGTTCSIDYFTRVVPHSHFLLCMFLADYVFPCCIIVYCYVWIFHTVQSHSLAFYPMTTGPGPRDKHKAAHRTTSGGNGGGSGCSSGSSSHNRMGSIRVFAPPGGAEGQRKLRWTQTEYKIARTVLVVILFYCMAWTPYAVVTLIGQYGDVHLITPTVSMLPAVFAKVSTVYNPIVYSLSHPRFKSQMRKMAAVLVPFCRRRAHLSRETSSRVSGRALPNRTVETSESPSHFDYEINMASAAAAAAAVTFGPNRRYLDVSVKTGGNDSRGGKGDRGSSVGFRELLEVKDFGRTASSQDEDTDDVTDADDAQSPTSAARSRLLSRSDATTTAAAAAAAAATSDQSNGIGDDNIDNVEGELLKPIHEVPERETASISDDDAHLMKAVLSGGRRKLNRAVFLRQGERGGGGGRVGGGGGGGGGGDRDLDRVHDENMSRATWRDISGESLLSVNIEAIRMERIA